MRSYPNILVPILLVLVACVHGGHASAYGGATSLSGHDYEFQITHQLSESLSPPTLGEWGEDDFDPVANGEHYVLSISADGRAFSLESLSSSASYCGCLTRGGSLAADIVAEASLCFDIDEGLSSGGQLVVWRDGESLRAELTILTKSRAVEGCERGHVLDIAG